MARRILPPESLPWPLSVAQGGLEIFTRPSGQRTLTVVLLEAKLKYTAAFHVMVIVVAVFGASVTFPLIVTSIAEPSNPGNVQTVQILLTVSWTLFVTAALWACLSAGEAYARGYIKAVRQAINEAKEAREKAMELVNAQSEPVLRNVLTQFQAEIESVRPSLETITALVEAFKATKHRHKTLESSAKEYRRLEKLHHGRAVMERLDAARLAADIEMRVGNARLLQAQQQAIEVHEDAAKSADNEAKEVAQLAVETEQRLAVFSHDVVITMNTISVRAMELLHSVRWDPATLEVGVQALSFNSVAVVVVLIGSALICLGVVIFMYTRVVGVIAIMCIALTALALVGVSILPSLELLFEVIARRVRVRG